MKKVPNQWPEILTEKQNVVKIKIYQREKKSHQKRQGLGRFRKSLLQKVYVCVCVCVAGGIKL